MAEQNFPDNVIYEADNLPVLRGMNSEAVDLIATDPPFNTKRNRAGTAGQYVDNWKWGDEGRLPDQWAWNEVHPVWLEEIKDENRALREVIEAARQCHGEDIAAFLCFLSVRLLEMHRVLKPTGSLYLHCDHTANAYIRMAMDAIFGSRNFKNEIVWRRTNSKNAVSKDFGKNHDTIFRYTKTKTSVFNKESVRTPYSPLADQIPEGYRWSPTHGRYIALAPVHAPEKRYGNSGQPAKFRGKIYDPPNDRHWVVPGEKREGETVSEGWARMDAAGRMYLAEGGKYPMSIRFLDEMPGIALDDLWTDISIPSKGESTGSPDQKPLALYERIVLASSNPGDLVLDPFAGCATTIMAARQHNRRWVGIDRRPDARFHVVCRMMGIRAKDAEEIRTNRPDLDDWLNAQLAQHEAHYRTEPPIRTDGGETAAPELGPVYTAPRERNLMNHREMHELLVQRWGLSCWGCDFMAPDPRHLVLDHILPKKDGGSNDLDNRALLCGPCNLAKSNRLTLSALRRQNRKDGYLKTKDAQHPINLPQALQWAREYMRDLIRKAPHQTSF